MMKFVIALIVLFASSPAFCAPRWTCWANDTKYGYEADGRDQKSAGRAAIKVCREQSDFPTHCFVLNCYTKGGHHSDPGNGGGFPGDRPDWCASHPTAPMCSGGNDYCYGHPNDPVCGDPSWCTSHPHEPPCG